jgi:prepilin-type N-terminal cleavage/methylation domain-containing protein
MTRTMRGRAAGFTLLEMLVVIMIMGAVMTMGTSTFVTVTTVWNERRAITELDNQAQAALESIRGDLASALSFEMSGVGLSGASREVKDDRTYPAGTHADDDLSFAVESDDGARGNARLAQVGYRVERTGATGTLVRTTGPMSGEFPAGGRLEVISARVQGFSVEYLGRSPDAAWSETWTGPGLPGAVRVSIALESNVRPEFQTARKVVIPIHVH